MRSSQVSFRKHVADIENRDDEDKREMDIVEITYPDGKVTAFPADHKSPETGVRYRDMFPRKYQAFKSGDTSEREEQLKSEIAQRQAELDGLKKDDKRVQENLGYGKIKPDEDPHSTDYKPGKIDHPVALGPDKHPLDPVLVQPVEPKTKEPV